MFYDHLIQGRRNTDYSRFKQQSPGTSNGISGQVRLVSPRVFRNSWIQWRRVTQTRIPESQESRQQERKPSSVCMCSEVLNSVDKRGQWTPLPGEVDSHYVELGSNLPTRCAERPSHHQIELAQSKDSTGYNLHGLSEFKFAANRVNRSTHATKSQLESVMVIPGRDLELAEFDKNLNKFEFETSRVNLPTRATRKPSRCNEFETWFHPKERERRREPRVELQTTDAVEQQTQSLDVRRIRRNARQNFTVCRANISERKPPERTIELKVESALPERHHRRQVESEERTNPPAPSTEPKESPCVDNSTPHSVEGSPRVEVETSNFGEEFGGSLNTEFDMNSNEFESAASGVNRPTRLTRRPGRYQDNEFKTQFRPKPKTRRREPHIESQNTDAIEQPSSNSRRIRGNARLNSKMYRREQTRSNYTARQAEVRLVSPRVFYDSLVRQRKASHQDDKDLRRTPSIDPSEEVESTLPERNIEHKVESLPEHRYRRHQYRCRITDGRSN